MKKKDISDIANEAYNLAYKYEADYGSCPQAVLRAISEIFQLKNMDLIIKSSHALAGGLGLSGNGSCGALIGGIIALGLFYGRDLKDMDKGRFLKSYIKAKELYDKFVKEFKSCICKDVQKIIFGKSFNLWNLEDYREFEELGAHRDKCTDVAGKVAKWVVEMLLTDKKVKPEIVGIGN